LVTADRRAARPLAAALYATGSETIVATATDNATALLAAGAIDLAVLECAAVSDYTRIADAADPTPVIALGRQVSPHAAIELVAAGASHVIPTRAAGFDAKELTIAVEKLLRRDLFGAGKYIGGFGVELFEHPLRCADDRDELVSIVVDYAASLGAGRQLAAAIGTIADELATNAIYNAPALETGAPRYAQLDRRDKIQLDPWEHAMARFGSDGERFVIAVADEFGRLRPARIRERLIACASRTRPTDDGSGGAGLGLYTVLTSCNQLVFNLAPERRTEVVAVANISGRMAGLRRGGHALHVFEDGTALPSPSVALSPALRVQIHEQLAHDEPPHEVIPLVAGTRREGAPETCRDDHSGQLLQFPGEPLGVDTMLGLIRGALRPARAVQLGLRFLTHCYSGAVAYELRDRLLHHWMACGEIADWQRARSTQLDVCGETALATIARRGAVEVFTPGAPIDRALCAMLAGAPEVPGIALPIAPSGELRYVLYAFAPAYDRPLAPRLRARLQRELSDTLNRLRSGRASSPPAIRKETA
jgi:hypothetical protein